MGLHAERCLLFFDLFALEILSLLSLCLCACVCRFRLVGVISLDGSCDVMQTDTYVLKMPHSGLRGPPAVRLQILHRVSVLSAVWRLPLFHPCVCVCRCIASVSASVVYLEARCYRSAQPVAADSILKDPTAFHSHLFPFFVSFFCPSCLFLSPHCPNSLVLPFCLFLYTTPSTNPDLKPSCLCVCIFHLSLGRTSVHSVSHHLAVKKANCEPCGGSSLIVLLMSLLIIIFPVHSVKSQHEVTNWPPALYANINVDCERRTALKFFMFYSQTVLVVAVFSGAANSHFLCEQQAWRPLWQWKNNNNCPLAGNLGCILALN